jgi:hypothetical protein
MQPNHDDQTSHDQEASRDPIQASKSSSSEIPSSENTVSASRTKSSKNQIVPLTKLSLDKISGPSLCPKAQGSQSFNAAPVVDANISEGSAVPYPSRTADDEQNAPEEAQNRPSKVVEQNQAKSVSVPKLNMAQNTLAALAKPPQSDTENRQKPLTLLDLDKVKTPAEFSSPRGLRMFSQTEIRAAAADEGSSSSSPAITTPRVPMQRKTINRLPSTDTTASMSFPTPRMSVAGDSLTSTYATLITPREPMLSSRDYAFTPRESMLSARESAFTPRDPRDSPRKPVPARHQIEVSVCAHVYVFVYVYVYVYVYASVYVHMYVYVYARVYMYVCLFGACTQINVCVCMCMCMCVCAHMLMCMCVFAYLCMCVCACLCARIRMHARCHVDISPQEKYHLINSIQFYHYCIYVNLCARVCAC